MGCPRRAPCLPVLLALVLLAAAIPPRPAAAAETVHLVRLIHRSAEELLPAVQAMLGPEGMASADPPSNGILLIDQAETVARIEAWLREMDQPVPHLQVQVRFDEEVREAGAEAAVAGRVEAGDLEVAAGDPPPEKEGVRAEAAAGSRQARQSGSYVITVASGGTAAIVSGRDVPYREDWVRLCRRYRLVAPSVRFLRVETGFEVRPVATADQVQVEITPRIGYLDESRRTGVVRFTEARTMVTAPLGQWIELAARDEAAQEVFAAILRRGEARREERLTIRLRISRM
jgi:hypothetical protein